jgi:hypothetical protein
MKYSSQLCEFHKLRYFTSNARFRIVVKHLMSLNGILCFFIKKNRSDLKTEIDLFHVLQVSVEASETCFTYCL